MTLKPILKKRPAPEPIQEEPEQLQCIVVFTDGACKNNGASRALAGIGVAWPYEKGHNYWGRLQGPQTNNRAEYKAVITALRIADKIDQSKLKPIYIFTDSNLVVQSMTEWLPGWKRNDWRKSDGGEIMNLDLVKELAGLIESRKVIFKHVRAHTGRDDWVSRWNAEADGFASRG